MTANAYSIIRAYFQYQRDIGVDDIIFDHGSEIRAILSRNTLPQRKNTVMDPVQAQAAQSRSPSKVAANRHVYAVERQTSVDNSAPLSKLSKIKTVDALDVKRVAPVSSPAPVVNTLKREKLAELYRDVINCDKCPLSQNRTKVVFGTGSADGKIFVIGGSPSQRDEAVGLPFQGDEGELFGKIVAKMGLDKKLDIFATYLQKCRSCDGGINRECAGVCKSILDKQIEIIAPKAILVFGEQPANVILGNNDAVDMEQLRNAKHTYMNKPVIVTYSLSLMSKEPAYRHGAWDDMKKVISA